MKDYNEMSNEEFFNLNIPLNQLKNMNKTDIKISKDEIDLNDERPINQIRYNTTGKSLKSKSNNENILGTKEEDNTVSFFDAILNVDKVEKDEEEEIIRYNKRVESNRDLYNSVSNYDKHYDEIEEELAKELNKSNNEEKKYDFFFKYKPNINKEGNLTIRIPYTASKDGVTNHIKYFEMPEYLQYRKDGVYFSSNTKRKHTVVKLSTYDLYTLHSDGSKEYLNPEDSRDFKRIKSYLMTFKYLNNNKQNYKWYMIYLSVFFDGFTNLKQFTKWYSQIKINYKQLKKDSLTIVLKDDLTKNLKKEEKLQFKNKIKAEYTNKVNAYINKQFILGVYKNMKNPICYENMLVYLTDRHISVDMVKKYLNEEGIYLKNEKEFQIEKKTMNAIDDIKFYLKNDVNKIKTINLTTFQSYLKSKYKVDLVLTTISKILNQNDIDLKNLERKRKDLVK